MTTTGPGERSPGPLVSQEIPPRKNPDEMENPEMTTDPNRCPVCACEMFTQVSDEWCPTGNVYYVTYRCVDHGHAWSETLTLTVRTVHNENGDRDIVVRETVH